MAKIEDETEGDDNISLHTEQNPHTVRLFHGSLAIAFWQVDATNNAFATGMRNRWTRKDFIVNGMTVATFANTRKGRWESEQLERAFQRIFVAGVEQFKYDLRNMLGVRER